MSKNCADCQHRILDGWCAAPKLAEVLDGTLHKNEIARCDPVRDFKVACGHEARWFTPKEQSK